VSNNKENLLKEIQPLTGIRAFASWWVVLFHISYLIPVMFAGVYWFARLGYLGVNLFFILSGFIISYNYEKRFIVFSFKIYYRFLWARFARLYPVHFLTLIISALFLLEIHVSKLVTVKNFSTWTLNNFLANVFLVHAWRMHYIESWNNASWAVSCEWFCYLVFPLIVLLKLKKISRCIAVILVILLPTIPTVFVQTKYSLPWNCLVTALCEFVAGCLVYHLYAQKIEHTYVYKTLSCVTSAGLIIMLILVWNFQCIASEWIALVFPFVILTVAESSGFINRMLSARVVMYWGKVSYSLYMTHNVTLWVLKALFPFHKNGAWIYQFVLYLTFISIITMLTYHFVEKPARKWLRSQPWRVNDRY
jgi:peptidoglycan/LPS O-acetylase OafA/YrhL